MTHIARFVGFCLTVVAIVATGCQGGSTSTLTGTVTVDGQPLKDGAVRFIPLDPSKGGTAGAVIKDGTFTCQVPVGEMRVEFNGAKVVGKRKAYDTPDSPMVDIVEELLPAKYNTQSELKITIKGGSQKETWALVTK
ncbi:MAG TPA: hypothetical protein VHR66_20165 [Gemmataceae bacterium]|nr:hypothetical protein [Gemmataceae bacterium]